MEFDRQANEDMGLPSWNDLAYHMFGLMPDDLRVVADLMADDELMLSSDPSVFHLNDDIYFIANDAAVGPPKTLEDLPRWVEPKLRDVWGDWIMKKGYLHDRVDQFGKLQSNINLYLAFFHH